MPPHPTAAPETLSSAVTIHAGTRVRRTNAVTRAAAPLMAITHTPGFTDRQVCWGSSASVITGAAAATEFPASSLITLTP